MMVSQLALVYGAYLLATASPGPSNMAIMGVTAAGPHWCWPPA